LIHHAQADLEQARQLALRARTLLGRDSLSSRIEAGRMLVRLWLLIMRCRLYLIVLRLADTRGR
jgi:hypothetical protein